MALAAHLTFSLFTLTSSLPKIPGRQLDLVKSEEVKIPNAFAFGIFGDPAEIRTPDTLLKRQVLCRLSYWVIFYSNMQRHEKSWQGWLDSNQRVRESKSLALPLGYTPVCGWILSHSGEKSAGRSRSSGPNAFVWGG